MIIPYTYMWSRRLHAYPMLQSGSMIELGISGPRHARQRFRRNHRSAKKLPVYYAQPLLPKPQPGVSLVCRGPRKRPNRGVVPRRRRGPGNCFPPRSLASMAAKVRPLPRARLRVLHRLARLPSTRLLCHLRWLPLVGHLPGRIQRLPHHEGQLHPPHQP